MKKPPVVILCGGQGSRLREETDLRPKPMVEIGGKPILWHIMKSYSHYGFNRFVLALGYKGDYIKNYFYNCRFLNNDFTITLDPGVPIQFHSSCAESDWEVTCVDTGEHTLKGGRIKRLEAFLDADRFHLTYGDGVSNININTLDEFHCKHGSIGTVSGVRPPSRFGEMTLNEDYVVQFEEKPQLHTGLINGGFFVFSRSFLQYLTPTENCDLEFGALQKLSADNQLRVYKHLDFWQCMDTIRDKTHLDNLWQKGQAAWKTWE